MPARLVRIDGGFALEDRDVDPAVILGTNWTLSRRAALPTPSMLIVGRRHGGMNAEEEEVEGMVFAVVVGSNVRAAAVFSGRSRLS